MGDVGSYIWFIGLGVGIVILGIAMAVAKSRGDPNHAWKQAAAETGHPEVARPDTR
jgi:type IV secretory pathway TrbD component